MTEATPGDLYADLVKILPHRRSLISEGSRETLAWLSDRLPLRIVRIKSGARFQGWQVPDEWILHSARLTSPQGEVIADASRSILEVVNYSAPVHERVELTQLQKNLHSSVVQKDAVPYVTSYYASNWGFCLNDFSRQHLSAGVYNAEIVSEFRPSFIDLAELYLPGKKKDEIWFSTYTCHPEMANDNTSGIIVSAALAEFVAALKPRTYSYRFFFIPETIGSLAVLETFREYLPRVTAGFVLTCLGDTAPFSFVPSRHGNTLADWVALRLLRRQTKWTEYGWRDRGSDERQYCAPGVDLPFCSITRSKYDTFPQYHTSADNASFVSPEGLHASLVFYKDLVEELECLDLPRARYLGEPQMSKYGLYPTVGGGQHSQALRILMDVLSFCDGENDALEIARKLGLREHEVREAVEILRSADLVA